MNRELSELYQEIILDHFRNPRGAAALAPEEVSVEKLNPACGDRVRLRVEVVDGILQGLTADLQACAIAVASASLLSDAVTGQPRERFEDLHERLRFALNGRPGEALPGQLAALSSVREFPVRIDCALLPWRALAEALA